MYWIRYVPIGTMLLGLGIATVGADMASSPDLALGLAVGGSAIAWSTAFGMTLLDDNAWGRWLGDERMERLCNRSGMAAWYLMLAVVSTLLLSLDHYEGTVSAELVLMGVSTVGVVSFIGALGYNERRM